MKNRIPSLAMAAFKLSVIFLALFYIGRFYYVAVSRIGFTFDLEWMEGAMVEHVLRVLAGEKIYVAPSLDFIPFIYAPLYYYVSAFASLIIGPGYLALRLVSLLSISGVFFLSGLIVYRETQKIHLGILTAGLFAATYGLGIAWFDLARVDSLLLLLLLLVFYLLRFHPGRRMYAVAGIIASLAFFTKQSAVVAIAGPGLYLFLFDRKKSWFFLIPCAVMSFAGIWILDRLHDGWFLHYLWRIPKSHPFLPERWWSFWRQDLMKAFLPTLLMGLFFLLYAISRSGERLLYLFFAVGMTAMAYIGRLKGGGDQNTVIPAYLIFCILTVLASDLFFKMSRAASGADRSVIILFVNILLVVQFLLLHYDTQELIPDRTDYRAGREFLATLSSFDGEVLVPFHGYICRKVGKHCGFNHQAANDLKKHSRDMGGFAREVERALAEIRYSAVITDSRWCFQKELEKYYQRRGPAVKSAKGLYAKSGWRLRPRTVWVPR